MRFAFLNSLTCNILLFLFPISFSYISFALCFPLLLNLQHTALSFPYFFFLHSFCALLSLTLQLATGCSSSYLFLPTCISFALCFPYISQLATRLLFLFPISSSYISFAPCFPILFNLQQVALPLTYFFLLTFLLRFVCLNSLTCNRLFFLLPIFLY